MSEHTFKWYLPEDYDEDESDVEVRFYFCPGDTRRRDYRASNPEMAPAIVEDVRVWEWRLEDWVEITGELTDYMDWFEEACWEHMREKEPQR